MTSIGQYDTAMFKGQLEPAFSGEAKKGSQDEVKNHAIDKIISAATNADGKIDPNSQFGAALKVREWKLETEQWGKEHPNKPEMVWDRVKRAESVDAKVSNPIEAARILKAEAGVPPQGMDSNAAASLYGVQIGATSAAGSVFKNADGTGDIPSDAHRESYQHLAEYMDIHPEKYGKPDGAANWKEKGDRFNVKEMQHIDAAGKDFLNDANTDASNEVRRSYTEVGDQKLASAADKVSNRLGNAPLPDETIDSALPASLSESQRGQDIAELFQKLAQLMVGQAKAG